MKSSKSKRVNAATIKLQLMCQEEGYFSKPEKFIITECVKSKLEEYLIPT